MVDVKVIYEHKNQDNYHNNDGFGWGFSNYDPMINAFGNAVVHESDNDYQGDDYVLYDNEGRVGHLIFGWGSCSGCDSLQACTSWEELQDLCDHLEGSIRWFDSYESALTWFCEHDWEGDWSWGRDKSREYRDESVKYLMDKIDPILTDKEIKHWGLAVFHTHIADGERAVPKYIKDVVEDRILNEKDLDLIRKNYLRRLEIAVEAGEEYDA